MDRVDQARLRLTGSVEPRRDGQKVLIQKEGRSGWQTIATAALTKATATRSHYAITLRLNPGRYRAYIAGDRAHWESISGTRIVREFVRTTLEVKMLNHRVQLSGTVSPRRDGWKVMLQRLTREGWRTVAKVPLKVATKTQSRYSATFSHLAAGRYRAFVYGDGAHRVGISSARVVNATGGRPGQATAGRATTTT